MPWESFPPASEISPQDLPLLPQIFSTRTVQFFIDFIEVSWYNSSSSVITISTLAADDLCSFPRPQPASLRQGGCQTVAGPSRFSHQLCTTHHPAAACSHYFWRKAIYARSDAAVLEDCCGYRPADDPRAACSDTDALVVKIPD